MKQPIPIAVITFPVLVFHVLLAAMVSQHAMIGMWDVVGLLFGMITMMFAVLAHGVVNSEQARSVLSSDEVEAIRMLVKHAGIATILFDCSVAYSVIH